MLDGKLWRENESKTFLEYLVEWEGRKINCEAHVFSPWTHQKVLSPKWRENWREKLVIIFGRKCPCTIVPSPILLFFTPFFFFFLLLIYWACVAFLTFFFLFLLIYWAACPVCFFFVQMWFFLRTWFLFFNKFRWLIFFLVVYHFFGFYWASFFNKNICVNLYKLTFSITSFLYSQQNKKEGKLKSFLSSHFSIIFPFSIIFLFYPSNQTDP